MPALIAVIEDEVKLASVLIDYLTARGYQTHHIADGAHAVQWIEEKQPDLVLLDIMLPNKDGVTICKEVRTFSAVPILMVTAKVEEIDRLLGLEIGADDYICKPFSPREVVARVAANLRRVAQAKQLLPNKEKIENLEANTSATLDQAHYTLYSDEGNKLCVDTNKMLVQVNDKSVELTAVEFRLLDKMASKPGQIFSRAQLIEASYNDNRIVSERTVDSHIKKLRKQINRVAPECTVIHSVYGVGYKIEIADNQD